MSEKESEGVKDNKSKRLMDSVEGSKEFDDDEKRSMRKKARVDYSEEKKLQVVGEPSKPAKEDDDDDIQVENVF